MKKYCRNIPIPSRIANKGNGYYAQIQQVCINFFRKPVAFGYIRNNIICSLTIALIVLGISSYASADVYINILAVNGTDEDKE